MPEVQGLDSTDPEGIGNDSLNALKGNSSIIDVLKSSLKTQVDVLNALRVLVKQTSSLSKSDMSSKNDDVIIPPVALLDNSSEKPMDEPDTDANALLGINETIATTMAQTEATMSNTSALLGLTDLIKTTTLDIKVSGVDTNFFIQLLNVAGNKKRLIGLETFGTVFEKVIIKLGSLDKYVKPLNEVAGALLGVFGTFKQFGKGLLFFAGGLALLGYTLITFMEAITLDDLITFVGIMLAIRIAGELVSGSAWDMAKVAVGVALLGLTVWAFTEVVTVKMASEFVDTLALISAGIFIMNTLAGGINGIGIAKGALAIAAIAGSVWLLNKAISDFDPVDIMLVGEMALITAGLADVWTVMGEFWSQIIMGAGAAAAIGGSLWLLAKGVESMQGISISLERGLELAAIIVSAAGVLTLIGNPITIGFTLAGAAGAAAIGAALWLLSKGLNAIGTVNVTQAQADIFAYSVEKTVDALSILGNPFTVVKMAVAVPVALAIAGSTLLLAGAMTAISLLKLQGPEHYDNFAYGISRIVEAYTSIGGWDIVKAGIAAGVITLVAGASMLTAFAINAFTKMSASPEAVTQAVFTLDSFISGIGNTLDKNKGKFSSIALGIDSFFGISKMVQEIAASVMAISNLEFYDKEIRNGKVVVVGVRKFTPADFANVGSSIGQILMALTDPLSQIGSKKDTYSIGGFTITNPFSNKVQEGIQAMMGIGQIFNPIVNMLRVFSDKKVDKTFISSFNKNLASVLQGISHAFSQDNLEIDDDTIDNMNEATDVLVKITGQITNPKFAKGVSMFKNLAANMVVIKNSLNGIDLTKLVKFNSMLTTLNDLNKTDNLKELVTVFKQFLDSFIEYTDKQESRASAAPITTTTTEKETKPVAKNTKLIDDIRNSQREDSKMSTDEMEKLLGQIYDFLISGQLKVTAKPGSLF